MDERNRRRLTELRRRQESGNLTYTERIELQLLESKEEDGEETAYAGEDVGVREEMEEEEEVETEAEGFEVLPPEGEEGDVKAPGSEERVSRRGEAEKTMEKTFEKRPGERADPEKTKMAVAFGAGALMGYFLKDLLEEDGGGLFEVDSTTDGTSKKKRKRRR